MHVALGGSILKAGVQVGCVKEIPERKEEIKKNVLGFYHASNTVTIYFIFRHL